MTYWENKIILERNFEIGSRFIDNLESIERIQKGFNVGTYTNLHFYLNNWFLFRIEFVGNDAIQIDYRRRNVPNKEIKSMDFFMVVKEIIKNSPAKNHYDFYRETIIIKFSNKEYLDLLNQAIDIYYEQVSIKVINKNTLNINHQEDLPVEIFHSHKEHRLENVNMNFRVASGINVSYFKINREERNLCAILFHVLLLEDNFTKFLKKVDCNFPIIDSEKGIYIEYAFIRDIWENIRIKYGVKKGNEIKRKFIIDILNLANKNKLEAMSIFDFNNLFVQSNIRTPSSKEIESPGNWSINKYHQNFIDNNEFLNICKFKWCFNAKPDIVIHTSNNQAICIEGKFKSGEGVYPINKNEKEIFKKRNLDFIRQLSIQPEIMKILNIDAKFILLANSSIYSNTHDFYTWREIFDILHTTNCPYFIKEWLKRSDLY